MSIRDKYDNLKKRYYDLIYTQPEDKKKKKWNTGSEYVQKVQDLKAIRNNQTMYQAALGIDATGDYGVLSNKKIIESDVRLSNDMETLKTDLADVSDPASFNFAGTTEEAKKVVNDFAKRRDDIIKERYSFLSEKRKEARNSFIKKSNEIYDDNTGGTFKEDFGSSSNRRSLINDFNNISKNLDEKELTKEYERIIKKHYKGKEMADNTDFKKWGEKIKNVATNDEVKKAMNTMSENEKTMNALISARKDIHKREEYNKRMDEKYGDDAKKYYRKGVNYEPLSWNEAEVNSHRGKISEARKVKGEKFNFGKGKVAMAVMGLAGLAGVTGLMFSGGRQQNSNLYNANQAMY